MKRLFTILFAKMLAGQAWAYDFQSGDLCYNITSDSTVEVTYQLFNKNDNYSSISTVTIPETVIYYETEYSVTSIGQIAFKNCKTLTSIDIPNSVTSIGAGAFEYCIGLTSIIIPNSVTSIGGSAFRGCNSLTTIDIPNGVTGISSATFYDCTGLITITIPNSVTYIGNSAFDNCTGLTSVTIGNGVTKIGDNAFYGCNNIDYTAYDNAFYIGNSENPYLVLMEAKNNNIQSCTINDNCQVICSNAFYDCRSLKSITIPNKIKSICDEAFYFCNSLTSATISNSVTYIGKGAFRCCSKLTSVTIPNSVTEIDDQAFEYCDGLESANIANGVIRIGGNSFCRCYKLKTVTIPNTVTNIDAGAFSCSGLLSITIPNSVKEIGYEAFRGCGSLQKAEFSSIESMCSIQFESYESNPLQCAKKLYINGELVTNPVIPNTVTDIGPYVFINCKNLKSVTIPSCVTNINRWAFDGCDSLTTVICHIAIPLIMEQDVFPNADTVYVPIESVDAYKSATFWKRKEILPFGIVTTKSNNETLGSIVQNDSILLSGKSITITATPNEGCHFFGWSDGNKDNPRTFTEAKDTTATALFEAHKVVTDAAVAATATETGLTEGSHCSVCGAVIVAQEVISALGEQGGNENNPGTAVSESATNAINIYTHGNAIIIENATEEIRVYDAMGRMIGRDAINRVRTEIRVNGTGVYLVKVGNIAKRVVVN